VQMKFLATCPSLWLSVRP